MSVPLLRFKEFRDNWLSSELDKIATTSSGGTPNRAKPEYWGGSIPWVTTSLIDFNVINNSDEFITEEGLKNSSAKLFPKDTLLMAMYGQGKTRGKVAILGLEASTNQACAAITFHQNTINIQFAFQNLAGRYDEIRDLSNAGGQENLSAGLIKQIKITFPSLPEQTKIANFLTAIDEKISQLTQKYDLLVQYKKGVMQQIFSQKLRFKDEDGREFSEWEEKKLGDVVDNYGGTALEEFVTEKGTHNFISIGNYEKDGRYFDNGQRITLNEKTKLRLLNAGELVMVLNDKTSSGDLIGSTLLIPEDNKYIYNQRSERLVCKSEIIDSKYAWHLLNSPKFRKLIYSISQGGTQIYVNFPSVKKLNAPIPSLPEQTKIANFLTAIDDKITHTRTQLDAVKLYKKGLLQQLFI